MNKSFGEIGLTITAIVIALVVLLLMRGCLDTPTGSVLEPVGGVIIERHIDTVERVVFRDRIVLTEVPFRRIQARRTNVEGHRLVAQVDTSDGRHDTLLLCEPFTASLDTIVGSDTAHMEIAFPPLRLSRFTLASSPDTLHDRVERVTVTSQVGRPWYQQAGEAIAWMAVGYGVRWASEPPCSNPRVQTRSPPLVVSFRMTF